MPKVSRITIRQINAELKRIGKKEELVAGRGYFYFVGPGTGNWYSTSVAVYRLNHLSLAQWVEALEELRP
jgi:hypothetical protein